MVSAFLMTTIEDSASVCLLVCLRHGEQAGLNPFEFNVCGLASNLLRRGKFGSVGAPVLTRKSYSKAHTHVQRNFFCMNFCN